MPTKIQWTDESWQPVVGCTKVSLGCDNCYAERMANRLACMGQAKYERVIRYIINKEVPRGFSGKWNGKVYCDEKALEIPLHWKKPRLIFVCSMGDIALTPYQFFIKIMNVIKECPQHTFQFLTKRPSELLNLCCRFYKHSDTIKNLWLGVTIEHPKYKHRADTLRRIPAAVRFLSLEPLLADMDELNLDGISWVIVGGESGPKARYCGTGDMGSIVYQCKEADVPVFVKQIHIWDTTEGKHRLVKDIDQFPEDLRIREYPKLKGISSDADSNNATE